MNEKDWIFDNLAKNILKFLQLELNFASATENNIILARRAILLLLIRRAIYSCSESNIIAHTESNIILIRSATSEEQY